MLSHTLPCHTDHNSWHNFMSKLGFRASRITAFKIWNTSITWDFHMSLENPFRVSTCDGAPLIRQSAWLAWAIDFGMISACIIIIIIIIILYFSLLIIICHHGLHPQSKNKPEPELRTTTLGNHNSLNSFTRWQWCYIQLQWFFTIDSNNLQFAPSSEYLYWFWNIMAILWMNVNYPESLQGIADWTLKQTPSTNALMLASPTFSAFWQTAIIKFQMFPLLYIRIISLDWLKTKNKFLVWWVVNDWMTVKWMTKLVTAKTCLSR